MVDQHSTTSGATRERAQSATGPVTTALRIMQDAHGERREIQALRQAIEDRIQADIDLLDALDRGEFAQ